MLYHFGKTTLTELQIVDESIELGDFCRGPKDKIYWRDVIKGMISRNSDRFASSSPDDVIIFLKNGVFVDPNSVVNTDTLTNGFHDILAFCLPTRGTIPTVDETPEGPLGWNKLFPEEARRRALEKKLHSTNGNSVESMNVRFEEIQMLLSACNQCALQVNKFSAQQQTLCKMNQLFFSQWKPLFESIMAVQRSVSTKFGDYVTKAKAPATLLFQLVTVIPSRHPDIPTITAFLEQSSEVTRLIGEGKQLRNDTQKLFDKGTRNFVVEARRALRIVDDAKAHLEQFYQKLTSVLTHVRAEWNYTARQGILFSHMVLYLRKLKEMDSILSDPSAVNSAQKTNANLENCLSDLKAIAEGCSHFHMATKQPARPVNPPPAHRPARTKSSASDVVSENMALRAQNEQLRNDLEEAHKEIARLQEQLAALLR